MPISIRALRDIEALLTDKRITYNGSEVLRLNEILSELKGEISEVTKTLRVIPVADVPTVQPIKEVVEG